MALSQCLRIPTSLLVDILCTWIPTESLGRLDSALLQSRKDRQIFEETIHTPYFCSIGLTDRSARKVGYSYLLWLCRRCIRVKKIVLVAPQFQQFPAVYSTISNTLQMENIHELKIDGNGDVYHFAKNVITKSKWIEHLGFANMPWLTYPRMRAFLKICSRTLKSLEIDTVKHLSGSHFVRLVPYFQNLLHLKLGRIPLNSELLAALTTHCRKLSSVSFASCEVHMDSLVYFLESYDTLASSASSNRADAVLRTPVSQKEGISPLRSLSLQHNTSINMAGIATCIATHCKCLHCLTLVGEYSTPNALHTHSVELIATQCTVLGYIDISKNNFITDEAVLAITTHCVGLKTLILHSCRGVTDTSVEGIAENCKHLEILDISWCDYITDLSLLHLTYSPTTGVRSTLLELKINNCCRIIHSKSVTDLIESCAKLSVDNVSCTYAKLI